MGTIEKIAVIGILLAGGYGAYKVLKPSTQTQTMLEEGVQFRRGGRIGFMGNGGDPLGVTGIPRSMAKRYQLMSPGSAFARHKEVGFMTSGGIPELPRSKIMMQRYNFSG